MDSSNSNVLRLVQQWCIGVFNSVGLRQSGVLRVVERSVDDDGEEMRQETHEETGASIDPRRY